MEYIQKESERVSFSFVVGKQEGCNFYGSMEYQLSIDVYIINKRKLYLIHIYEEP